jgi:predicted alpha/beta-hydrolase family hydrolase
MRPYVKALQARGLEAGAIELRKGRSLPAAEKALPLFLAYPPETVIGGHSFGGRVASLAAAQQPFKALILLSYPLHRPGHPEDLRTEHWPKIECPVIVLSGESDPFARIDLLRKSVRLLRNHELVTYPHVGHGLVSVAEDAMSQVVAFLAKLRT